MYKFFGLLLTYPHTYVHSHFLRLAFERSGDDTKLGYHRPSKDKRHIIIIANDLLFNSLALSKHSREKNRQQSFVGG